jgi:alpha-galactosidase
VQIGMHPATLVDFDIPRAFGLKQTIADTAGIGGIFRGLRTIPFMLEMAAEMATLCPTATLLNYTNPMSILTRAVYEAFPKLPVVGLCHNVQFTARDLAGYLKVASERLSYRCGGINHMCWFLDLQIDGKDAYPQLWQAMEDPAIYAEDKVRFELMKWYGRFISESSEHNAEYNGYFLKRDDQIAAFDVPIDEYVRRSERNLRRYAETRAKLLAGEPFPIERSVEYGSLIIHAIVTGRQRLIYGNVRNDRLIDNLPEGCCVEVPVVVDRNGLQPVRIGALPPQLAGYCAPHTYSQDLVVRAAIEEDPAHLYQATLLDPQIATALTLAEIRRLVDAMLTAHADMLPEGLRPRSAHAIVRS